MFNPSSIQSNPDETDRNACNAAFYELGFRWFWDSATYADLWRRSSSPVEQIRHFLETHQSHLLRAYDAAFLADAVQTKKTEIHQRTAQSGGLPSEYFDWSRCLDREVGV